MQLKTVLFALVFVFIGLLVVIMLGYFGVSPFSVIYQAGHNWVSSFDVKAAVSNLATLVTAAVPTVTAIGAAVAVINKTKTSAQQQVQAAES